MNVIPESPEALEQAMKVLQSGGVVAHATETCYGLACDIRNPEAVAKLFEIKKRPQDMPVSALFASIEQAKEYTEWSERAQELADEQLPGPLTIILPLKEAILRGTSLCHGEEPLSASEGVSRTIHSEVPQDDNPATQLKRLYPTPEGGTTIGIRISSYPFAQRLVETFGSPLTTTSANIHGEPNPYDIKNISRCDLSIDSGLLEAKKSSTVISLLGENDQILRS